MVVAEKDENGGAKSKPKYPKPPVDISSTIASMPSGFSQDPFKTLRVEIEAISRHVKILWVRFGSPKQRTYINFRFIEEMGRVVGWVRSHGTEEDLKMVLLCSDNQEIWLQGFDPDMIWDLSDLRGASDL